VTAPKKQTRTQRWSEAVSQAQEGLATLQEMMEDFQEWYDNMPENLQSSATGELLQEIIRLDIDGAVNTVDEAEAVQIPLGFGRD
jgi:hypothetical protein